ncbi:small-subunit processome [Kockiozyma suomiensis]|uniref:small-subunit processome n=1 Tax=Kockiozyma suomiensis TaxID=1337062 RepID=UPI0033437A89
MSSLKFAVQHKEHRERSQPANRRKWGLLEKHKDYVLRAQDYHSKEKRIKILREKAQARNPDEFYFGMYSSKTFSASGSRGMREQSRESSVALTAEQMKLLRTQDAGYLNTLLMQEQRAIEKLISQLAFTDGAWADQESNSSDAEYQDSDYDYSDLDEDEDQTQKSNKARMTQDKKSRRLKKNHTVFTDSFTGAPRTDTTAKKLNSQPTKYQEDLLSQLSQRKQRRSQIEEVLKEAQLQKNLLGKGPRKKIVKPDGKAVWKWSNQRKR